MGRSRKWGLEKYRILNMEIGSLDREIGSLDREVLG
jgi:hypothetical protein